MILSVPDNAFVSCFKNSNYLNKLNKLPVIMETGLLKLRIVAPEPIIILQLPLQKMGLPETGVHQLLLILRIMAIGALPSQLLQMGRYILLHVKMNFHTIREILKYAFYDGNFHYEDVDTSSQVGKFASIAVDGGRVVHIATTMKT